MKNFWRFTTVLNCEKANCNSFYLSNASKHDPNGLNFSKNIIQVEWEKVCNIFDDWSVFGQVALLQRTIFGEIREIGSFLVIFQHYLHPPPLLLQHTSLWTNLSKILNISVGNVKILCFRGQKCSFLLIMKEHKSCKLNHFWALWQLVAGFNMEFIFHAKLKFNLEIINRLVEMWLEAKDNLRKSWWFRRLQNSQYHQL